MFLVGGFPSPLLRKKHVGLSMYVLNYTIVVYYKKRLNYFIKNGQFILISLSNLTSCKCKLRVEASIFYYVLFLFLRELFPFAACADGFWLNAVFVSAANLELQGLANVICPGPSTFHESDTDHTRQPVLAFKQ